MESVGLGEVGSRAMTFALHGNLGAAADWRVREFFGGETETVDLWTDVEEGLEMNAWADRFCRQVRQSPDGEKPWLAGYSLGGRLALHALLAEPELWRGAVIVSAHPGLRNETERQARLIRDREWSDRVRNGNWEEFLDLWNAQPVFAGQSMDETLARQRSLEGQREAVAQAFDSWSLGRQGDLRSQLFECPVPVLWVSGVNDEKFSRIAAEVADVTPCAEHSLIENCGHRVLDDAPDALAGAIGDFQKRIL